MTVVTFGKTAVHAHIRIKMSVLLKMNIKPTSSKAQQVGEFFTHLSSRRGDPSDRVVDVHISAA